MHMKKNNQNCVRSLALLLGIVAFGTPASAQRSDVVMRRYVLDEALSTIEEYEACSTIGDDEVYYDFLSLFVNREVPVYNDLLGLSTAASMPVSEYVDKMKTGLRNKMVSVRNVTTEKPWKEDGVWKVRLVFDKSVSYANQCGILFSSSEFYGCDYRLTATLVYNEADGVCKIESIIGNVDSEKRLPDQYFAFKTTDKRDKDLRYYGDKLTFNSYGQAFLRGTFDEHGFNYTDVDVDLVPSVDECGIASMKYKVHKLRMKPHYDLGLGDAYTVDGSNALGNPKSSTSSFGIDIGYSFPSEGMLKTAMFFGLGLEQSHVDLSFRSNDYFYNTDADVDHDSYVRHYSDLSLSQSVKLSELYVPVYLDLSYRANRLLSVYADLGAQININMKHDIDKTSGSAIIYGVYPQYDNLMLDGGWGYNGFGAHYYGSQDLVSDGLEGVAAYTVDVLAGAGFRISIPKTALAIDFGFGYQLGLMDVITNDNGQIGLENGATNPVVFNTVSGTNSTERLHNLSETLSGMKRKTLKLNLGLIIKL